MARRLGGQGSTMDRALLPRVKACLTEKSISLSSADVWDTLVFLQARYPEYRRKPRNTLKAAIERAIEILRSNEPESMEEASDSVSELREQLEAAEVEEAEKKEAAASLMNQSLRTIYAQATPKGTSPVDQIGSAPLSSSSSAPLRKVRKQTETDSPSMRRSQSSAVRREGESKAKESESLRVEPPKTRYTDLGGMEKTLQDVRELVERPMTHPEIYSFLGVEPPRGVLLHGPPGCGKTLLASAIAGELGVAFYKVSAPEIVSGVSGESEARLRQVFREAAQSAPSLIFIDEIDAITSKRSSDSRAMERRIVAQLLTCMDELTLERTNGACVMVLGATNRADAIDPGLRRAGRFDREIHIGVPDETIAQSLRLDGAFDYFEIARNTPGFVGADLAALCKEAATLAINRIFANVEHELMHTDDASEADDHMDIEKTPASVMEASTPSQPPNQIAPVLKTKREEEDFALQQRERVTKRLREHAAFRPDELGELCITMEDFLAAITLVQPSSQREGFAVVPNVSWADVGALQSVRVELEMALLAPIRHREKYEQVGLTATASGLLLYGPPGCGKTLLAKAIATEASLNFLSVKGPELLNKYVGESEKAVRTTFARARSSAPCLIFFDEVDALCPRRDSQSDSAVSQRLVNQMLTELDGLDTRNEVFVVAASNRPDMIDPALLRPGRIDKMIYLALPSAEDRADILRAASRKTPMDSTVDLRAIAHDPRCHGFSGADVAHLVREAQEACLRGSIEHSQPLVVTKEHFEFALGRVLPSVTQRDERRYEAMHKTLIHARSRSKKEAADAPPNAEEPAPPVQPQL